MIKAVRDTEYELIKDHSNAYAQLIKDGQNPYRVIVDFFDYRTTGGSGAEDYAHMIYEKKVNTGSYEYIDLSSLHSNYTPDTNLIIIKIDLSSDMDYDPFELQIIGITEKQESESTTWIVDPLWGLGLTTINLQLAIPLFEADPNTLPAIVVSIDEDEDSSILGTRIEDLKNVSNLLLAYLQGDKNAILTAAERVVSGTYLGDDSASSAPSPSPSMSPSALSLIPTSNLKPTSTPTPTPTPTPNIPGNGVYSAARFSVGGKVVKLYS